MVQTHCCCPLYLVCVDLFVAIFQKRLFEFDSLYDGCLHDPQLILHLEVDL